MLFVFFIFLIIQNKTKLGRYAYAIGGSIETSKLVGINTKLYRRLYYILLGLTCGIAGIIWVSRAMAVGPGAGTQFEFDVILAVFLGGTKLGGGKGNIVNLFFGTLILATVNNWLNLNGITDYYRQLATGGIFIMAVLLNKYIKRSGGLKEE